MAIDFELPEEHQTVGETARAFARSEVAPHARAWDEAGAVPPARVAQLGELGLLGIEVPESLGGAGLDPLALVVVLEELARADGSMAAVVAAHNAVAVRLVLQAAGGGRAGSPESAAAAGLLRALAAGERLASCSCSLAGDGSGAGAVRATPGAGGWQLEGRSGLHAPGAAKVHLVVAEVGPGADSADGPAVFSVPDDAGGLTRTTAPGLGLRAAGWTDLELDGVRLGEEACLATGAWARRAVHGAITRGRLALAALALGLGEGALEQAVAYGRERIQFGSPITGFQAIQWMIADARTELEGARLLVRRAAWALGRGESERGEAVGEAVGEAAGRAVAAARLQAVRAARLACDHALQVHGGYGYTRDFPVERFLRDAATTGILLRGDDGARAELATRVLGGD